MIKMTKKAAERLKETVANKSMPESTMLRINIEHVEGQGELNVALNLDTQEPGPDDEVETTEGARLVIRKELAQALGNGELDVEEDLGGFVFRRAEVIQ